MNGRKFILIVFILSFLFSCSTLKINKEYLKKIQYKKYYISNSVNLIYRIETTGNVRDTEVEKQIGRKIHSLLSNSKERNKFTLAPIVNETNKLYQTFVREIFKQLNKTDLEESSISEELINYFFKDVKEEFIVLIKHTGFYRTTGGMMRGACKGILIGILTLGMFYTVPIQAKSHFEYCIIDRKKLKFVMYNKSYTESDPREDNTLEDHLKELFEDINELFGKE